MTRSSEIHDKPYDIPFEYPTIHYARTIQPTSDHEPLPFANFLSANLCYANNKSIGVGHPLNNNNGTKIYTPKL